MVYALKFYFFLLLSPISSVSIICILYSHGFSFVLYIDDNKARVTGEWKKVVHNNNNNYHVGRICAKGKASENFKKTTHTLTHTTKQLTFCSFIILLLTLFILFGVCVCMCATHYGIKASMHKITTKITIGKRERRKRRRYLNVSHRIRCDNNKMWTAIVQLLRVVHWEQWRAAIDAIRAWNRIMAQKRRQNMQKLCTHTESKFWIIKGKTEATATYTISISFFFIYRALNVCARVSFWEIRAVCMVFFSTLVRLHTYSENIFYQW